MNDPDESRPSPDPSPPTEQSYEPHVTDVEMRRRAAAVLEVLGGAKSPAEAAESLGLSLPRYYQLEARALEGLIAACEPRTRGRPSGGGHTLHALQKENEQLRQDLSRTMALARAVQRAAGVPEAKGDDRAFTDGRVRRRRRPRARALRAAQALAPEAPPVSPSSSEARPTEDGSSGVEPPP